MFREMRRANQQLGAEECIELLMSERRGVLSLLGEDGYPYGIPMNHWYDPESGTICFHGAKSGHKLDALTACDKVSYCVHDAGVPTGREGREWELRVRSKGAFSPRLEA